MTKLIRVLLGLVAGVLVLWVVYSVVTFGVAPTVAAFIDWVIETLREIARLSTSIPDIQ